MRSQTVLLSFDVERSREDQGAGNGEELMKQIIRKERKAKLELAKFTQVCQCYQQRTEVCRHPLPLYPSSSSSRVPDPFLRHLHLLTLMFSNVSLLRFFLFLFATFTSLTNSVWYYHSKLIFQNSITCSKQLDHLS